MLMKEIRSIVRLQKMNCDIAGDHCTRIFLIIEALWLSAAEVLVHAFFFCTQLYIMDKREIMDGWMDFISNNFYFPS